MIIKSMRKSFLFLFILLVFVSGCAKPLPKLRVVMGLGETEWQVMRQDIFPDFEKEHKVKIEPIQMEAGDLPQVLEAQIAAGRLEIDLIAQDNMQLSYLVRKNLVEDLSSYEAKLPKAVLPALVAAGKFGNKLYFLPYRPNVQITYYNQKVFNKYGIKPPKNWTELMRVARLFFRKENVGKILFKAYGGTPTATQLYEWIVSAGGDPFTLNDAGCRKTFAYLQRLWLYCSPDSVRAKFDTSNEYFARDSAYLMQNWPFGVKVITQEYKKTGLATYHGFRGPRREAHVVGGEVLGIPKGATQKELALKFIAYLQSKSVQEKLVSKLGWPSMRSDAYLNVSKEMQPHFKSINQALEHGIFRKNVPYWNDYVKYVNEAFDSIVVQGTPPRRALDYYHDQLKLAKQRM